MLPDFFVEKLNKQYGEEISKEIIEGLSKKRYTTFRVNSIKASNEEVEEVLNKNGINFEKVEWTQDAYVLKDNKESDIEALDIYKDGKIYLESLS